MLIILKYYIKFMYKMSQTDWCTAEHDFHRFVALKRVVLVYLTKPVGQRLVYCKPLLARTWCKHAHVHGLAQVLDMRCLEETVLKKIVSSLSTIFFNAFTIFLIGIWSGSLWPFLLVLRMGLFCSESVHCIPNCK